LFLYWPRSKQGPTATPAEPALQPASARAEGLVLVVEDNPEVADVSVTLIEQLGYRTLRAENAAEALRHLAGPETIDLVFSDIVMPNGMNGIHLAQEIVERHPAVRILLTTGYSDVVAAAETCFPVLRKPFEVSALERAVREVMAGAAGGAPRRAAR
jgi:CheY-like chemotaxis protein